MKITEGDSSLIKYCEKFGQLILGSDTSLSIGCLECMDEYINVGGYCMANLTQS